MFYSISRALLNKQGHYNETNVYWKYLRDRCGVWKVTGGFYINISVEYKLFFTHRKRILCITVSSSFLISFVMGWERPEQGD